MQQNSLSIASLNLASALVDENGPQPLHRRINGIQNFIHTNSIKHRFSIICLQEVRKTGTSTALDVILQIQKGLGPDWEFIDQKVNPSPGAFHRTILWNNRFYSLHHQETYYTENSQYSQYPYMFTKSYFCRTGCRDNIPLFSVINGHTPVLRRDRIIAWQAMKDKLDPNTILIGDLNKFENEHQEYKRIFNEPLVDLLGLREETFVSFSNDLNPSGKLWRSCLDAVVINCDYLNGVAGVESTEANRVSDHFLIVAKINLNQ